MQLPANTCSRSGSPVSVKQLHQQHGCDTGASPTCMGHHGCWANLSRFCSGEEAGMRRPHEACPMLCGWCLALSFHTGMNMDIHGDKRLHQHFENRHVRRVQRLNVLATNSILSVSLTDRRSSLFRMRRRCRRWAAVSWTDR